jgi:hypothetical protein
MRRPKLEPTSIPVPFPEPAGLYMTMSPGQWDMFLQNAYDMGWTLLEIEEVDGEEKAVRAFKRLNSPN